MEGASGSLTVGSVPHRKKGPEDQKSFPDMTGLLLRSYRYVAACPQSRNLLTNEKAFR